LKCWYCGENLHYHARPDRVTAYYFCSKDTEQHRVNGANVLQLVHAMFVDELGDYSVTEKRVTRANDLSHEIQESRSAFAELTRFISTSTDSEGRRLLFEQLAALEKRIQSLESQSTETDSVEWISTGQTYRELWDTLDEQGKRLLMVRAGLTVRVHQLTKGSKRGPGVLETEFIVPEDLKQRLGIM
jgi:hypothetical protein